MSSNDTPVVIQCGDELPATGWSRGRFLSRNIPREGAMLADPQENTVHDEPDLQE
jgi:hypothetical protein